MCPTVTKHVCLEVFSVYDCDDRWCFYHFPTENLRGLVDHGIRLPDYFVFLDDDERFVALETCVKNQAHPFIAPVVEYLAKSRMN